MVKHTRKRRGNIAFQVLQVDSEMDLLTLADNAVESSALTVLADDFWVISADLNWTINGTVNEFPIQVGLANGDLSDAEIKEGVTASPISRSDIVERE